jgi:hypothetical protein
LSLVAALFAVAVAPLPAQSVDEPVKMTPEFPLTFPFDFDKANQLVSVKFPVMINPTTILKPGNVLRTVYVLQQNDDDSSNPLGIAHSTDTAEAYSRSNSSTSGEPKMPYELAHQLESYRRTVWNTPTNFQLAMAQFPTYLMHLIYLPTEKSRDADLLDQRFSFFDGLFVGQPDASGAVVVLGVEIDSKADAAGIKAGDEIVAVGGSPVQHDLLTFASAFANARHSAREMDAPNYTVTVHSPGQAVRDVKVAMPPTIKSSLLHGL